MKLASLLAGMTALLGSIAGCDSGSAFVADLGQSGTPPALDAAVGAAGVAGTPVTFTGASGSALPDAIAGAKTARVTLGGASLPLTKAGAGLATVVPLTVSFARPIDGSADSVVFILDGDRSLIARVTYK